MTVWFFIYSIAKRAEALTLVDLGATENFMNLAYAQWLKLPIKLLKKTQKLFNIDRTENKSGELKYYSISKTQPPLEITWTFLMPLDPLQVCLKSISRGKFCDLKCTCTRDFLLIKFVWSCISILILYFFHLFAPFHTWPILQNWSWEKKKIQVAVKLFQALIKSSRSSV